MSFLDKRIKSILDQKGLTFNWLADQIGYSRQGLKSGLVNKTIKFDALEKIADVLEIGLDTFYYPETGHIYLKNRLILTLSKRYSKVTDKIAFYKDYFVHASLNLIFQGLKPNLVEWIGYTVEDIGLKEDDPYFQLRNLGPDALLTPYSLWPDEWIKVMMKTDIIDQFYFSIFETDFFFIQGYLNDDFGNKEIQNYYGKWLKIKIPEINAKKRNKSD